MTMKSFLIALAPVLLLSLQPDDSRSREFAPRPFPPSEDDLKPTLTRRKLRRMLRKYFRAIITVSSTSTTPYRRRCMTTT